MNMKRMDWAIVGVVVVLLGSAMGMMLLYTQMPGVDRREAILELWKTLSNFALIVTLGGVVSALLKRIETRRERARSMHDFRAEFLAKFQGAYRSTKTVRRRLRAAGLTTMRRDPLTTLTNAQVTAYRDEMTMLNEAQLDFEDLALELSNFPRAFSGGERIEDIVKRIESYLRAVLREYENHWRRLSPDEEGQSSFNSLKELQDFTGSFKNGQYRAKVVKGRREAIGLIQSDLLSLELARVPE
jgi:hypothetical protein